MKYYKYGLMGAVLTLTFDLVVCSVSMIYGQETPSSNGLQELQSQITELKQKTNRLEAKAQANNTVDYGNEALKQGIALIEQELLDLQSGASLKLLIVEHRGFQLTESGYVLLDLQNPNYYFQDHVF
jgi:hypothetical protein